MLGIHVDLPLGGLGEVGGMVPEPVLPDLGNLEVRAPGWKGLPHHMSAWQ